jgi:hypothetical protein
VRRVFVLPGAKVDRVIEALRVTPEIEMVLCRNEQTAAFMAAGRETGFLCVCVCVCRARPQQHTANLTPPPNTQKNKRPRPPHRPRRRRHRHERPGRH